MRFFLSPVFFSALSTVVSGSVVFEPHRISFSELVAKDFSSSFLDALTDVGIIAIKDIPGYTSTKNRALSCLHSCSVDASESRKITLKDGTVRHTFATRTVAGPGGAQKILKNKNEEGLSPSCNDFIQSSDGLRSAVDSATRAFANKLGLVIQSFGNDAKNPLLSTEDGSHAFENFGDVVEYGDHLEHFHSYQSGNPSELKEETIEMHTDQGLYIAFTPAMMASSLETEQNALVSASGGGGFDIELRDGTRASVDFQPDDLIIMLGDGIDQIVNPYLNNGNGRKLELRSTPHALTMPTYSEGEVRVWHGRMVLPPSSAVHPEHGTTFGQMRKLMMEASTVEKSNNGLNNAAEEKSLSLGCSSSAASARILEEEVVCEPESTYCWHRCMPHVDHGVSLEICASRNLQTQCINPRNQVYIEGHGDFFPACSNATEPATEYPKLPSWPRDEDTCSGESWENFASTAGYDFVFDRLGDNQGQRGYWEGHENKGIGKVAKFMWNINNKDEVEGKVVFNGLFGYISFGLAKEGGKKNGMNGASIIMAVPGGNYSALNGLDLDMEPSVNEYVISLGSSSFRHWDAPVEGVDTSTYGVEYNECFTALTFVTGKINNIPFNLDGSDKVLWAANNQDSFCGSHGRGQDGRGDRDAFMINWKTGEAWFPVEIEEEEYTETNGDHDHDSHDHEDGTDHKEGTMSDSSTASAVFFSMMNLFLSVSIAFFGVM